MSKIVWDATGSRYYENGVDHGVLYVQKSDGSYDTGVAWNGLTGVTESPDGAEPTDLWADNIKYASMRSAETFGATIEAYTYPDEFAECDGSAEPVDGVRFGQQQRKPFGFVYRTNVGSDTLTSTDEGYKIHIIYNATASPSERAYETINDSPDAITFSWEITTTPINATGYKPLSTIVIDSTKIDPAKLTLIENMLFGTDAVEESELGADDGTPATDPTLPAPDDLLDLIKDAASAETTVEEPAAGGGQ